MKNKSKKTILLVMLIFAFVCSQQRIFVAAQEIVRFKTKDKTTVFVNVNIVPMDKERVLTNQTLVVRNGRIAEIGAANKIKIPADALQIDGRGKFLMPGLVDMHPHLWSGAGTFEDIAARHKTQTQLANLRAANSTINK